jgi:hypothetical protein
MQFKSPLSFHNITVWPSGQMRGGLIRIEITRERLLDETARQREKKKVRCQREMIAKAAEERFKSKGGKLLGTRESGREGKPLRKLVKKSSGDVIANTTASLRGGWGSKSENNDDDDGDDDDDNHSDNDNDNDDDNEQEKNQEQASNIRGFARRGRNNHASWSSTSQSTNAWGTTTTGSQPPRRAFEGTGHRLGSITTSQSSRSTQSSQGVIPSTGRSSSSSSSSSSSPERSTVTTSTHDNGNSSPIQEAIKSTTAATSYDFESAIILNIHVFDRAAFDFLQRQAGVGSQEDGSALPGALDAIALHDDRFVEVILATKTTA